MLQSVWSLACHCAASGLPSSIGYYQMWLKRKIHSTGGNFAHRSNIICTICRNTNMWRWQTVILNRKKVTLQSCHLQNVSAANGEHLKVYGWVLHFGLEGNGVRMGWGMSGSLSHLPSLTPLQQWGPKLAELKRQRGFLPTFSPGAKLSGAVQYDKV